MQLANPMMRFLAQRVEGLQKAVIVLHFRGRSGRNFDLPVGYRLVDGTITLLSNSRWRHNFRGGADLEVTYRGRRQPARATLIEDPEMVADLYRRLSEDLEPSQVARRLGFRINLDRHPTRQEWQEAIQRERMSIVELEPTDPESPVL